MTAGCVNPAHLDDPKERTRLLKQIADLEARLADLQRRLPAHSIPPSMLAALDEIDEQLAELHASLAAIQQSPKAPGGSGAA